MIRLQLSDHLSQVQFPQKIDGLTATVLPDGRWLLYNHTDNLAITLTAPAGILWALCDGQTDVAGFVTQFETLYPGVPASQLETEILAMLHQFMEQGLVFDSIAS